MVELQTDKYDSNFLFFTGLNCAEAVNFAPADWLPHGSYGADLYRLYHKPAVLSHEELICVVAKVKFILYFINVNYLSVIFLLNLLVILKRYAS